MCTKYHNDSKFSDRHVWTNSVDPDQTGGARWLSGRVSDSGARGPGFETYRRRVGPLEQDTLLPESTG